MLENPFCLLIVILNKAHWLSIPVIKLAMAPLKDSNLVGFPETSGAW